MTIHVSSEETVIARAQSDSHKRIAKTKGEKQCKQQKQKVIATKGYATHDTSAKFAPFDFTRRDVGPNDILIDIAVLRHLPLGHSPGKE